MKGRRRHPAAILGVDGGGTKTVAWVADEDGYVLGRGLEPRPSNQKAVGPTMALDALAGAVDKAFRDAEGGGHSVSEIQVACLGLAGFDRPEDRAMLETWFGAKGLFGRLILVNDGEILLSAGTPEGWGVAVIAGTGSIAVGKTADGRSARAGGWGHVFGDEGSGYGTAVAALRRVAGRFDGRLAGGSEDDPLTSAICRATGIDDPSGLVSAIYAPDSDRAKIAALAACVVEASAADPSITRDLLEPAGVALAATAIAVAARLDLPRDGLPLALAGGFLLSSQAVSRAMLGEIERVGYRVLPSCVEEPVAGAIALAKRALSL